MEFTKEQQIYAEIVQKAWEDEDFKARLVANPVPTIEEFTGKKVNIPEGKTLIVRDQTDENTVYINIPPTNEVEEDVELNEDQLEAVAGGTLQPKIGEIDIIKCFPIWPISFPKDGSPFSPFQIPKIDKS